MSSVWPAFFRVCESWSWPRSIVLEWSLCFEPPISARKPWRDLGSCFFWWAWSRSHKVHPTSQFLLPNLQRKPISVIIAFDVVHHGKLQQWDAYDAIPYFPEMGGKYHPHSGLQSGFTTVAIYWKAPAVLELWGVFVMRNDGRSCVRRAERS